MIRPLGILVAAVGLMAAGPAEVTGQARVVDGDTFSVGAISDGRMFPIACIAEDRAIVRA